MTVAGFNRSQSGFRALGMGGTRGRLYIKHPHLFKVSAVYFLGVGGNLPASSPGHWEFEWVGHF